MRSGVLRGMLVGALVLLTAAAVVAQAPKTVTLTGTVVQVEGNTLAVKMASGDMRVFTPPADRRFMIDGQSLTLSQLRPGMSLTATVTETATTVMDRTVQKLSGRVWYAAGPTVILTLASGENRMYTVKSDDPVKFYNADGKEMTVFDLRKGMNINATKITETPRAEFVSSAVVTGTAAAAGSAAGSGGAAAGAAAPARAVSGLRRPRRLRRLRRARPPQRRLRPRRRRCRKRRARCRSSACSAWRRWRLEPVSPGCAGGTAVRLPPGAPAGDGAQNATASGRSEYV